MSGLQSLIGQLGIFMICAQAIMHFRPKEAYEKYLRLLLSIMILMQMIQPVYGFFQRSESEEWEVSLEYFRERLDASMEKAVEQAVVSEELLEQMTLEEVQERLESEEGNTIADSEDDIAMEVAPIQVELGKVELGETEPDEALLSGSQLSGSELNEVEP